MTTIFKLKAASCVLIEDDCNKNVLPLISELIEHFGHKDELKILCYEQPTNVWQNISSGNLLCFNDSQLNEWSQVNSSADKCFYIIDSVNQMILDIGWIQCIQYIRSLLLNSGVKLILISHRDCLTNTKIQTQLNHLANAIVSYDKINPNKVRVQIKKGGKLFKSEEIISHNVLTSTIKMTPIVKEIVNAIEPEKVLPNELSTFKIEIDQIQQLEKNKLKLPYMSKINEGKGKVYYEPDAVDDWDDEDPDDDLDI